MSDQTNAATSQPPILTDELISEIKNETGRTEGSIMRRALGLPVKGRAGVDVDRAFDRRGGIRLAKGA